MDTLTTSERSVRMASIRSKNTKPELIIRKIAHRLGYRYRLHRKGLPGSPDLVFPSRKKVVFVHGCFWHSHDGCKVANQPKSRRSYWTEKFTRNKIRDKLNERRLRKDGWGVCTIWECETRNAEKAARRLARFLGPAGTKVTTTKVTTKGGRHGG